MITFDKLKQQITPEIIKKMVELAEGFEWRNEYNIYFKNSIVRYTYNDLKNDINMFPLLLHRAVEGWNKINPCKPIQILCNCISFITDEDEPASIEWGYDNEQYQPCHLTQCEMAIWDCLLNILYWEEEANSLEIQLSELQEKYEELKQQNDYLIEALIKEVKQSYEDTGSYSNLSMQVLRNITKKTAEEILTGGER